MKSDFEERKANRVEAYQNLAAKNEQISDSSYKHSHVLGDMIPLGQPILVGHHSEGAHRAHVNKIDNAMRTSVEASKKADYYADRAETILNGTAISSDDPNAIDKLNEKLVKLMARQELYKAINKIVKSTKATTDQKAASIVALGLKETTAAGLLEPDRMGRVGIPSYSLTNNNGVISNTRKRIEHLTKLEAIKSTTEDINGVTLKISSEDNRVQLYFPGKPDEAVRKSLSSNGFHWTPSLGAWQRQISAHAIYLAKDILNSLNKT
jgi:hypothetical protein